MKTIYDFEAVQINGQSLPLSQLQGKVMLIVNTASACGFTPQFGGLEKIHQTFKDQGLAVLGFPCNQFGGQDPASNAVIADFLPSQLRRDFHYDAKGQCEWPRSAPALPMVVR
jgi:glutathione peroxidase